PPTPKARSSAPDRCRLAVAYGTVDLGIDRHRGIVRTGRDLPSAAGAAATFAPAPAAARPRLSQLRRRTDGGAYDHRSDGRRSPGAAAAAAAPVGGEHHRVRAVRPPSHSPAAPAPARYTHLRGGRAGARQP